MRGDALVPRIGCNVDSVGVDACDPRTHAEFDAELFECRRRLRGESVAECCEWFLASVHEQDPDRRGIKGPEVAPEAAYRELADLTGDLDTGRSGADHHDGQPGLLLGWVAGDFGHLERPEDPAPELDRVVEGLHPGREEGKLVVTEVRLVHAGGHDETVVRDFDRVVERARREHDAPIEIESGDLGELDADVGVPLQRVAQRHCDLSLGEDAGCDLVQQGLEQVMVAAVEQHDIDGPATEQTARREAAETAADDHDAMPARWIDSFARR